MYATDFKFDGELASSYGLIIRSFNGAGDVQSIRNGADAAKRLRSMSNKDWGSLRMTRVQLESVRRNAPELFYPAVGFCSGIPGGTSLGFIFGLGKKYLGKFFK